MWYLMAISLLTLQFNKKLSLVLLLVTTAVASYTRVLDERALAFLVILAIIAIIYCKFSSKSKMLSITLETLLLLASVGLMLHVIPGFHNVKILDNVRAGPESSPFSMYYNFDKALIPFVLLICMESLFIMNTRRHTRHWYWLVLVVAVPALLMIAVPLGVLKVEIHNPDWLFQFVLANIFFVSLAEEALFRGYLQQRLSSVFPPKLALIIVSLMFGALHYSGGSLLVIFATLAGLIYGLAWMLSGRLWVAVLFHVGLNLCHLLFFTYPVFQRLPY
ncbi:CPBP family intramembrane glutamic endopeptidase [Citrobacter braakii]|uniref:CPBP family intramembrane glutamic endopeptidase n=1 Tax=Citrobacter braakii TaxID=57706 RepID=UPI002B24667B|nr:CPBP family intramembrane glutamic endopeptidase [Citrobacter braakii]MEB2307294.1 CPBP family intramembrane metalloprotease [Citrobacter braakii]